MTKQTFSSFQDLKSLLPEDKVAKQNLPQSKAKKPKVQKAQKVYKPKQIKPKEPIDPKLQAIFDALNWLKKTFPKAFISNPAKITPLKVGMGQDLMEFIKKQEEPKYSLNLVRKALSMYTKNYHYLKASSKMGNPRIDLEGNIQGEVTAEQVEYAKTKLAQLMKKREKSK